MDILQVPAILSYLTPEGLALQAAQSIDPQVFPSEGSNFEAFELIREFTFQDPGWLSEYGPYLAEGDEIPDSFLQDSVPVNEVKKS